jgi:tetratricopeptide (TPR) repeat protein
MARSFLVRLLAAPCAFPFHSRAQGSAWTTVLLARFLVALLAVSFPADAHAQAGGKNAANPSTPGARPDDVRASTPAAKDAPSPPGYDAAIDQALAEFERGNFVDAREHFLRAHKILPNARTLRALGKAEFELKSYADAVAHLQLSLDSLVRPLTTQQRLETQVLLERAHRHLARYTFITAPADAQLTLDGIAPPLDAQHSLLLGEGAYQLEVRAEGYVSLRRDLQVTGGLDERLSLELTALATELPAPVLPVEAQHSEAQPLRRKWWLWTGIAAVVVAGAATAVVLSMHNSEEARANGGSTGVVLDVRKPQLFSY